MILFDTDVCVEIIRNNTKVVKRIQEYPGDIAVSFLTVAELYYGAEISDNSVTNRVVVDKFLLTMAVIHSDMGILSRFGEIKSVLYKGNILVPDADIFVAATALEKCEALVTGNVKYFTRMPGLRVENWIRS